MVRSRRRSLRSRLGGEEEVRKGRRVEARALGLFWRFGRWVWRVGGKARSRLLSCHLRRAHRGYLKEGERDQPFVAEGMVVLLVWMVLKVHSHLQSLLLHLTHGDSWVVG